MAMNFFKCSYLSFNFGRQLCMIYQPGSCFVLVLKQCTPSSGCWNCNGFTFQVIRLSSLTTVKIVFFDWTFGALTFMCHRSDLCWSWPFGFLYSSFSWVLNSFLLFENISTIISANNMLLVLSSDIFLVPIYFSLLWVI